MWFLVFLCVCVCVRACACAGDMFLSKAFKCKTKKRSRNIKEIIWCFKNLTNYSVNIVLEGEQLSHYSW